jgi:hypothetical protein
MSGRPKSTVSVRSDTITISLTDAEANSFQSEVKSIPPEVSDLRIFVFNKEENAVRIDGRGKEGGHISLFYDVMKKALLMACGAYMSDKGLATLKDMAGIWIKANYTTSKNPTKDADAAAVAWQKEIREGNLPPVVVNWEESADGGTIFPTQPPTVLDGKTEKCLESITISLPGPVSMSNSG